MGLLEAYNHLLGQAEEAALLDLYWSSGQLVLWQLFPVCAVHASAGCSMSG